MKEIETHSCIPNALQIFLEYSKLNLKSVNLIVSKSTENMAKMIRYVSPLRDRITEMSNIGDNNRVIGIVERNVNMNHDTSGQLLELVMTNKAENINEKDELTTDVFDKTDLELTNNLSTPFFQEQSSLINNVDENKVIKLNNVNNKDTTSFYNSERNLSARQLRVFNGLKRLSK